MDYWLKQSRDKPLFEDLMWSRPQTKNMSGKLLIIGGNVNNFVKVNQAYNSALAAGVGKVTLLLPDILEKQLRHLITSAVFAPSTSSGSFAKLALSQFIELSEWSDGCLLAGDLGNNSETIILLESFISKTNNILTLAGDTLDDLIMQSEIIINRQKTILVLDISQLQKLAKHIKFTLAFTHNMDYLNLIKHLHVLSSQYQSAIVIYHLDSIFVSYKGRICSMKLDNQNFNPTNQAAASSVWALQNPNKIFQTLCCSII